MESGGSILALQRLSSRNIFELLNLLIISFNHLRTSVNLASLRHRMSLQILTSFVCSSAEKMRKARLASITVWCVADIISEYYDYAMNRVAE